MEVALTRSINLINAAKILGPQGIKDVNLFHVYLRDTLR